MRSLGSIPATSTAWLLDDGIHGISRNVDEETGFANGRSACIHESLSGRCLDLLLFLHLCIVAFCRYILISSRVYGVEEVQHKQKQTVVLGASVYLIDVFVKFRPIGGNEIEDMYSLAVQEIFVLYCKTFEKICFCCRRIHHDIIYDFFLIFLSLSKSV